MDNGELVADVAELNNNNNEALYNAVSADDLSTLQLLLEQGTDADTFYDDDHNISSKSILHIACGKGRTQCVKALLRAGAMPDIHDKWGQTPLHYCICVQFLDAAQALLDHVGNGAIHIVNNQDCFGKSCLHTAAESANLEAMELLLKYGADVNIRNFDGITPLMICAENCALSKSVKSMEVLFEAGAMVNIVDYRSKRSALQRAVVCKNSLAVEYLLSVGAEVDSLDITRRTPLTNIMWEHVRNRQGHCNIDSDVMTIIVLLTQAGADLDLAVCEYSNPLVTAAFLQAPVLLKFFLDQGANPNATFRSGVTPLLIATSKKDIDCVRVLLYHNSSMTTKGLVFRKRLGMEFTFDSFEMALDDGSLDLVQLFLSTGYQPSSVQRGLLDKMLQTEEEKSKQVESEEVLQWLLTHLSGPVRLQELCVYALRNIMDHRLHSHVAHLPIPSRVKDNILLKHILT